MKLLSTIKRLRRLPQTPILTYTISIRPASFQVGPQPSPPRLPKEEQAIFEELQRRSTGAFSTPQSAESTAPTQVEQSATQEQSNETLKAQIKAAGEGEELHPHVRRGAPPEFKGDVNPKTGEINGPKNEPLRWGAGGDYSYNGRVTDF